MDVTSYSLHQKQISCNQKINPLESGCKKSQQKASFQKISQVRTFPPAKVDACVTIDATILLLNAVLPLSFLYIF